MKCTVHVDNRSINPSLEMTEQREQNQACLSFADSQLARDSTREIDDD